MEQVAFPEIPSIVYGPAPLDELSMGLQSVKARDETPQWVEMPFVRRQSSKTQGWNVLAMNLLRVARPLTIRILFRVPRRLCYQREVD